MRLARVLPVVVFAVVALFLLGGLGGVAMAYTPQAIEPAPFLEGNATISTHLSTYTTTEYPSGNSTGDLASSAILDSRVPNPIQINPAGLVSAPLETKVAGTVWNATAQWVTTAGSVCGTDGQVCKAPTTTTINGNTVVQFSANATSKAASYAYSDTENHGAVTEFNVSSYPSTNALFDYFTIIVGFSGTCAGCYGQVMFYNASGLASPTHGGIPGQLASSGALIPLTAYTTYGFAGTGTASTLYDTTPGNVFFLSAPLSSISGPGTGLNISGSLSATTGFGLTVGMYLPAETSTPLTATVYGMGLTTYPFSFGSSYWGGKTGIAQGAFARQISFGNLTFATLSPTFAYTSVTGGDYTIAIQATAGLSTGATINEAPNSNGSEQVTYSVPLSLPSVSGLTYGTFKLVDIPTLQGWQYVSVQFAGTVYTGVYQTKSNVGNFTTVAASVNPTTGGTWLGVVVYTQSQWQSISSPPGFFSVNGFQYYWYLLIIAIASGLGVGSAWAVRKSDSLRVR